MLFVHVLSGTGLLGPVYLLPLLARSRGKTLGVPLLRVEVLVQRFALAFAMVVFISGGWLIGLSPFTKDGRFGEARWLHFGMALFFVLGGLLSGLAGPRTAKALTALQNGDEVSARKQLAVADKVTPAIGAIGAVIVYLMVNKP
jgi:hypothetical protein